uniref:Uncharacterized protein n=1 Tax=Trichinella nativa TaxID=6335 RepID=A0A0V1KIL3_9BILA
MQHRLSSETMTEKKFTIHCEVKRGQGRTGEMAQ